MFVKIRFKCKCHVTSFTFKWFFTSMCMFVLFEIWLLRHFISTNLTEEWFFSSVCSHMFLEICFLYSSVNTTLTFKWFIISVYSHAFWNHQFVPLHICRDHIEITSQQLLHFAFLNQLLAQPHICRYHIAISPQSVYTCDQWNVLMPVCIHQTRMFSQHESSNAFLNYAYEQLHIHKPHKWMASHQCV